MMTTASHHRTHGASPEDQAIARLIGMLRRRSAGKPRTTGAQRPATRAVRSSGAVAEWHAMGRTF